MKVFITPLSSPSYLPFHSFLPPFFLSLSFIYLVCISLCTSFYSSNHVMCVTYMCMCVFREMWVLEYICLCMYVHTCIRVYMCVYVYMYTYIHMCICICVHVYICICICVYVCVCVYIYIYIYRTSQVVLMVENQPANAGDVRDGFNPWVRKIPWRRAWQPIQYSCLENPKERRLAGYHL